VPKVDYVRSDHELGDACLGPLEWSVMEVLWREKDCTVRDVVRKLPHRRAYTTVMTTMARLYRKGVLNRTLVGRTFRYSVRLTPQELDGRSVQRLLSYLLRIQARSTAPKMVALQILKALFDSDHELFEAVVEQVRTNRATNYGEFGDHSAAGPFYSSREGS